MSALSDLISKPAATPPSTGGGSALSALINGNSAPTASQTPTTSNTQTSALKSLLVGSGTPTPPTKATPAPTNPAPIATQDWNGQKIPANIPTKNLIAYDQQTGNKTFKMPDFTGGGAYTEDAQGNIVKQGHTTYGGEPAQAGMQRDDIIPAGVGGANSQKDNIKMVPLSTAHQQDTLETQEADAVKKGQIQPKAAITDITSKKQAIANKPSLLDILGSFGGDVKAGFNNTFNKPKSPTLQAAVGENLPEGTGAGTKGGANATVKRAAQPDVAPQTPYNMDFKSLPASFLRMLPRGVAQLTEIGAHAFGGQDRTTEPVTMSPLARFILGDDTIKDPVSAANDYEQALKAKGVEGHTATGLAVTGAAAEVVGNLLPLLAPLEASAQEAADSLATASKTATLSPEQLGDLAKADLSSLPADQQAVGERLQPMFQDAADQGKSLTIDARTQPETIPGKIAKAIGGENKAPFMSVSEAETPARLGAAAEESPKETLQLPSGETTTVGDTVSNPITAIGRKPFETYIPESVTPAAQVIIDQVNKNLIQSVSDYEAKSLAEFGSPNVISADTAKYSLGLAPGNAEKSDDYHPAAKALANMLYDEKVNTERGKGNNTVLFTAGGTGAGKTTALRNLANLKDYPIIFDTNLAGENAIAKIQKALGHGFNVAIKYIHRNPEMSFEHGVIPRVATEGRVVDIELHLERHQNAFGTLNKIHQNFQNNPNVDIKVINNTGGKGQEFATTLDNIKDFVHNGNINELRNKLYDIANQAKQSGQITPAEHKAIVQRTEIQRAGSKNNAGTNRKLEKKQAGNKKELDTLIKEAQKYKSVEDFRQAIKGGKTQYGDYSPEVRAKIPAGYQNITELGIKPDEMITVYRGIDDISNKVKRKINDGDFVTTDFDSALSYTGNPKDVVEMQVPAKTLYVSEPRDFKDEHFYTGAEYIYTTKTTKPIPTDTQLTDIWNEAHKETKIEKSEFKIYDNNENIKDFFSAKNAKLVKLPFNNKGFVTKTGFAYDKQGISRPAETKNWMVYEKQTGLMVGSGSTQDKAIQAATDEINKRGEEKTTESIKKTLDYQKASHITKSPIESEKTPIQIANEMAKKFEPMNEIAGKIYQGGFGLTQKEATQIAKESITTKVKPETPDIHRGSLKGLRMKKTEWRSIVQESQRFDDSEMESGYKKFVQRYSKFRNNPPEDYQQFVDQIPEAKNWFYSGDFGEPEVFDKFVERYKQKESVMLSAGFNPGVDKFIDQEAKPAAEALAAGAKTVYATLQKGVTAFMDGLDLGARVSRVFGGDTYAEVIKAIHNPEAEEHQFGLQESKQIDKNFNEVEKYLGDKFPEKDLRNFNLAFGEPSTVEGQALKIDAEKALPPELKDPIWNQIRKEASDWAFALAKESGIDLNYFEDYFYGAYKPAEGKEATVAEFMDYWRSTDAWTKNKVFPTAADAASRGMELKDQNPITNIKKEVRSIAHRVGMKDLSEHFAELADQELSGVFNKDTISPEQLGMVKKIQDPMFKKMLFDPALAKFVNNLLETNKLSQNLLTKSLRYLAYGAQRIKFFFSLYHMRNEITAMMSDQAFGMFDPAGYKNIAKSFKTDRSWQKTPEYDEYLRLGGGHSYSQESQALARRSFTKFLDRVNTGNYLGATTHAIIGTINIPSQITKWLFDSFIPRMKFEQFRADVVAQESKLGYGISDAKKIDVIKTNQNFYGEMNERLFGRRSTLTSALRLVFSAPGYGEGNFRVAGKALGMNQDILGKFLSKDVLNSAGFKQAAKEAGANYNQKGGARSARFVAQSLLTAFILASVGTYIYTKKLPKIPKNENDTRDLFKIHTNMKDGNGDDIYFDMMSYQKDFWTLYGNAAFGQFGQILPDLQTRFGGATSGVAQVMTDMSLLIENKMIYDYKGTPIYNKTDTFAEKIQKFIGYLAGEVQPISSSSYQQGVQKSGNALQAAALSYFGISSATSEDVKDLKAMRNDLFSLRDDRDKVLVTLDTLYKENPTEAIKQQQAYDKKQADKINALVNKYPVGKALADSLRKRLTIGDLSTKKTKTKTKAASTSAESIINQVLNR